MKKLLFALVALTSVASANPRALPFTYTTDTLAPGEAELEQTVDLVPLVGFSPQGFRNYVLASAFQTELEIGVADRLELALYFTWAPTISQDLAIGVAQLPDSNGIKQRVRYIFAPQGAWPIDVGVYGELSENEHEFEIEAKLLLQKRFDKLRIAANLWAEYELYFGRGEAGTHERDVVLHPTLGATYEVTPSFHVGVDTWMRGEYPTNPSETRNFELGPEYYVGPSVMMAFKKVWWTVAAYARVSDLDHHLQPGEVYGNFWFRTMVGYDL
ncbi:MAG: hypothetical protein ABI678_00525 [Kofleriaceae bacterium]